MMLYPRLEIPGFRSGWRFFDKVSSLVLTFVTNEKQTANL